MQLTIKNKLTNAKMNMRILNKILFTEIASIFETSFQNPTFTSVVVIHGVFEWKV